LRRSPSLQLRDLFRYSISSKRLGPGLISGTADDDPTAIVTYAQAGARTGYALL
jgi:Mn2+/Fe2+ NRAMP family transporter